MIDDLKQGLTYDGWERDVRNVEVTWTIGQVDIQSVVVFFSRCVGLYFFLYKTRTKPTRAVYFSRMVPLVCAPPGGAARVCG
jgi:hypothetical protein